MIESLEQASAALERLGRELRRPVDRRQARRRSRATGERFSVVKVRGRNVYRFASDEAKGTA